MKRKRIIFRILLLASIAILMILLCGCRTRLSNNSDVHSRVEDDTGYMSENYEYRREDLGLSTAEKPLINPDNGEDEEDYDDDFEYEPTTTDTYEDDYTTDDTEPDEPDSGSTTTTRPTSGTTRRSTTGIRRPSTTTTTSIRVNLNANGGTSKRTTIYVRKGSTYGTLPSPERDGYKFTGWYTKKEGGKKVTSKTKVTASSTHTLYAHWEVQKNKTYKVSFDGNAGSDKVKLSDESITVEEGGTYGDLAQASRDGYFFDGWYTKAEGGDKVEKGDKFTANANQTLYAHWDGSHNDEWWEQEFRTAANDVKESKYRTYYIIDDYPDCPIDNKEFSKVDRMLEDCKGSLETHEGYAEYSVLLLSPGEGTFEEIAEAAALAYLAYNDEHADDGDKCSGNVIVISKDAIKNNNNNLIARLNILNEMHSKDLDAEKAAEQLGVDKTQVYIFKR